MLRVLFIDDEDSILHFYKVLFADIVDVTVTTKPLEALELLQTKDYDYCFADFRMPGLNGLELKEKAVNTKARFYLVTGELDIKEAEGFVEVIHKPNHIDRITLIIKELAAEKGEEN